MWFLKQIDGKQLPVKMWYYSSKWSTKYVTLLITDKNVQYGDAFQPNTGSDQSVSRDAYSAAEFHCILQQLITHCTPFSNNMPPFSAFLSSITAPPRPKSPAGGLAWSQHKLDTRINTQYWTLKYKKNMCVCMCVPASQSLMSPFLWVQLLVSHPVKKKLGVCVWMCAHVCMTVWVMHREAEQHSKILWSSCCFSCSKSVYEH